MHDAQLIVANEDTFVGKIKKFFHNIKIKLFKDKENVEKNNIKNNLGQNERKSKLINELRADFTNTNQIIEKDKFLENISKNNKALDMLSTDRLRKLSKYYDEVIEKNNEIIKKLKESA